MSLCCQGKAITGLVITFSLYSNIRFDIFESCKCSIMYIYMPNAFIRLSVLVTYSALFGKSASVSVIFFSLTTDLIEPVICSSGYKTSFITHILYHMLEYFLHKFHIKKNESDKIIKILEKKC